MKKRLLSMILTMACLLSLAACGGPRTEAPETSGTSNSANQATEPSAGGSSTSPTENIAQNPGKKENTTVTLKYATAFSDGAAYVTISETTVENGETKTDEYSAIIDTSGNILHRFTEGELSGTVLGTSGIQLEKLNPFINGAAYFENIIFDKSFQVIASPETNGYDTVCARNENNGNYIVSKKEASFSGDKYYFGILDSKGNYIQPLSDTHPIAVYAAETLASSVDLKYVSDSYISINMRSSTSKYYSAYYHITTNEITPSYQNPYYELDNRSVGDALYRIDSQGNKTVIDKSRQYDYERITGSIFLRYNSHGSKEYDLFDAESNSVIIDFGTYDLYGTGHYYDGLYLTRAKNAQGVEYLCLFDKSGKPVFEPILGSFSSKNFWFTTDGGFIAMKEADDAHKNGVTDITVYFYDYNGNFTTFDIDYAEYIYFADPSPIVGYEDGWCCIKCPVSHNAQGQLTYHYKYINFKGESLF